jgi:hypothetical protein
MDDSSRHRRRGGPTLRTTDPDGETGTAVYECILTTLTLCCTLNVLRNNRMNSNGLNTNRHHAKELLQKLQKHSSSIKLKAFYN